MRIIAGEHRSRRLVTPAGRDVRPTSDRAREAMFASMGSIVGARALDLFAGSGALGLEALSRGAVSCLFVERDAAALDALQTNIAALGEEARATVERGDATAVLEQLAETGAQFDLMLIDPPYASFEALEPTLQRYLPELLAPGGWVVIETAAEMQPTLDGTFEHYNRRIGAARIVILWSEVA